MLARARAATGAIALLTLAGGCHREHHAAAEAQTPAASPGTIAQEDGDGGASARSASANAGAIPAATVASAAGPPAPGYVGSAVCASCHKKKLTAWHRSWHARALAPARASSVVGNFDHAHFAGTSSEAWMWQKGGRFLVRTRGSDGTAGDFPVGWVIGGKRMQDSLTVLDDGRWQVLPVYFHVTGHEWVDYTEKKQGPLTPDHPYFWANFRRMANHECLDCHTTGLQVSFDPTAARWTTGFADAGVACEDCHGPGARHAETMAAADIFRPDKAPRAQSLSVCAQCHGPREPLFPLLDSRDRFHPGARYDDFYDPIVVLIQGRISGDFFPDGRPRSSSFEYQAFLQSACYRRGKATCLSCHAPPHAPHHTDELRDDDPDRGCRSCHAAEFRAGSKHTHHKAAAAQRCVACHMPRLVSGVLDTFPDHTIDVPVPGNTQRHGVPSACDLCHRDRPAAQLAGDLARLWPGATARQARRLRLADAFDPRTAADSAGPLAKVVADRSEAPTLRGAAALLLAQRFAARAAAAISPLLASRDPLLRARACEALGVAGARGAADKVARLLRDPSLRVRLAAALSLAALGDARAEPALEALADDPATERLLPPHLTLGPLLAQRGDMAGARRELETVATLAPYYPDALEELAEVAARQGDLDEARRRIDECLRLDPGNQRAQRLRARL